MLSLICIFLDDGDHEVDLVQGIISAHYVDLSYSDGTKQPIIVPLPTDAIRQFFYQGCILPLKYSSLSSLSVEQVVEFQVLHFPNVQHHFFQVHFFIHIIIYSNSEND